jgi:uncharacterized protein (TIGR00730 family)
MPTNIPKTVCAYCASSDAVDAAYGDAATDLGRLLGERGDTLVYGGGAIGLMGMLARATQAHGGRVIGVIPESLRTKELAWEEADELIVTPDLRTRKHEMDVRADAFIALPGGFGTLEEIVEILTLKQLHLHDKAVVFLNTDDFWSPLFELFDHFFDHRFAKPVCRDLYHVADTPNDALDYLDRYVPTTIDHKWY